MVQSTSVEVYHKVKSSGLLSRIREEVYDILYKHGPLTMREAFELLNTDGVNIQSYGPRFAELRNMDLIEQCGERECKITGHNKILWQTTNSIGKKLPKKLSKKEKISGLLDLMVDLAKDLSEEQKVKLRVIYLKTEDL